MIRLARSRHKEGTSSGPALGDQGSPYRPRSQPGIIGYPQTPRESESRSDLGRAGGGAGPALPKEPYGTGEAGRVANTWEHVRETKRRAPVNQGPAVSRSMRSGSPNDSLLEHLSARIGLYLGDQVIGRSRLPSNCVSTVTLQRGDTS